MQFQSYFSTVLNMSKFWKAFFFVFIFLSCNKKKDEFIVKDISIATEYDFTQSIYLGNKAILIGGERYLVSMIYLLNENENLQKIEIVNPEVNKKLTGISKNQLGELIAVGYNGKILTSSDSGSTWSFQQSNLWEDFLNIDFKKNDTAYAVGGIPFKTGFFTTVDKNGKGIDTAKEHRNFVIEDIDFVNEKTAYLCGYGAVMKSNDGGLVWDFLSAKNDYFKAMAWQNENSGAVVGYEGSILLTSDGGAHWKTIRNGNNFLTSKIRFKAVAFNGEHTYVGVGDHGAVMLSSNNGSNWREMKRFTTKDLNGISFKNPNECLVTGSKGGAFLLKL